ncbi:hypothetical protein XENOCAPTIV_005368 [Xenoophorus captivus]|uniref:Vomeronasal type-1 receptor n=1 Tax=Xenoophorus captivus TaxID=1517983 RepID=A0ABV0QZW9_9TELE
MSDSEDIKGYISFCIGFANIYFQLYTRVQNTSKKLQVILCQLYRFGKVFFSNIFVFLCSLSVRLTQHRKRIDSQNANEVHQPKKLNLGSVLMFFHPALFTMNF